MLSLWNYIGLLIVFIIFGLIIANFEWSENFYIIYVTLRQRPHMIYAIMMLLTVK